jgi:TRAP-type C4-dicarboxylate transport system permease small subunit
MSARLVSLVRALDRTLARASGAAIALGGLILGLIALLGAADVALAALASAPLPAANAIAEEFLPPAVFLAMGAGVRAKAHIVVDLVVGRLQGRMRLVLGAVATLCSMLFLLALAHGAWGLAADSIALRERAVAAVEFPVWPTKVLFALGAALAFAEGVAACLGALASLVPAQQALVVVPARKEPA